jgi:hypothetical protein
MEEKRKVQDCMRGNQSTITDGLVAIFLTRKVSLFFSTAKKMII